ncbi:hypothetical protein SAMN03159444_01902 [Pseudomonas sp. NFACC02]|uniref:hypothetical protein n=1 Tax=Pseudomonas sp. NFACC02 TaxID=1566250 RepID=UPI0008BD21B6|nr:hypothetical protein [Pseudomonas sp. NFACC02]SEQ54392.1 hypothetical protein SAMN03159444_01902 [Pseudomonas sp. NFACC02]
MNIQATFSPNLGVFKHHFENDPIVPGIMILDFYVSHDATINLCESAYISKARFHNFVRPGEQVSFVKHPSGEIRIGFGDTLCGTFFLDRSGKRTLPLPEIFSSSTLPVLAEVLREPEYWFLPEEIEVDAAQRLAICQINLEAIQHRHPYLREIAHWRPLVLIECAGNLALVLQHLATSEATPSKYVFAQFDEIGYREDCTSWATQQTVVTQVKRFGSTLVWEAWVGDAVSTQIMIRGAVSRKGKVQ